MIETRKILETTLKPPQNPERLKKPAPKKVYIGVKEA